MHPVLIQYQATQQTAVFANFDQDDQAAHVHAIYAGRERASIALLLRSDAFVLKITPKLRSMLGITKGPEDVVLPRHGAHIQEMRPDEAAAIFAAMPHALTYPRYFGQQGPGGATHMLLGESECGRLLLVGVTLEPPDFSPLSNSVRILTAYFVDDAEVRRLIGLRRLRDCE